MKPIFFPFTFVSETLLETFHFFFEEFILYHPSAAKIPEYYQKWAEKGAIDLRTPMTGDEERLDKLVVEYQEWLEHHRGSETTFLKNRLFDNLGIEATPMFSETATSQIKADIKRGEIMQSSAKPDSSMAIRLFLLIAHAFDQQHDAFNRDMEKFRDLEEVLLHTMKGEDDFAQESPRKIGAAIAEDVGRYKTAQRIISWLELFKKDPLEPDEYGNWLFITTSEAVLDQIPLYFRDMPPAYSTGLVSVDPPNREKSSEIKEIVTQNLIRLSKNQAGAKPTSMPEPSTSGARVGEWKIFPFPGKTPQTLFKEEPPDLAPPEITNGVHPPTIFVAKFEPSCI